MGPKRHESLLEPQNALHIGVGARPVQHDILTAKPVASVRKEVCPFDHGVLAICLTVPQMD